MGSALVAQKFTRFETWRRRARPACQEKINAGIAAYVILHPFALSIDIALTVVNRTPLFCARQQTSSALE
jgi:hypothetical protein